MGSFGKFLISKGILTPDQLEEATHALVVVGGRLGTNAVDLGYLGVEQLDALLAEHYGVAQPPAEWVQNPEPAALEALPAAVARRLAVMPLAVRDRTLHVAMANPRDLLAADEIRFASGLDLLPYILSDIHLAFLRERYLGIPRSGRFSYLEPDWVKGPARKKRRKRTVPKRVAAPTEEMTPEEREAIGIRPLEGGEELSDPSLFDVEPAAVGLPQAPAPPEEEEEVLLLDTPLGQDPCPPDSPADVGRLERELDEASDRRIIGDRALRLAVIHARAAALFVVHQGAVRGDRARGEAVERRIGGLLLAADSHSVLARAAQGQAYRGPPPREGIDGALFDALGRTDACEVAVLPVKIGERVVNVLYVDNGPDPLPQTTAAALVSLCQCMSRAYERIIRTKKRRHC